MFSSLGDRDGQLQRLLRFRYLAAKYHQLTKRIIDAGYMYVIFDIGDRQRLPDHPFGLFPFADEHQIDAEIVVSDDGIQRMLRLVEKLDRFLETRDAVLWSTQKPIGTRHVGVEFPEHKGRRIVADDLDAEFKVLE